MALQFLAPDREILPVSKPVRPLRVSIVNAPSIPDYPAILRSPLFAPDRRGGEDEPGSLAGGLDAWRVLGAATGHRLAMAVVQGPYGAPKSITPGQSLEGWRLAAILPGRLLFVKAGERRTLPIGQPAQAAAKAAPAETDSGEAGDPS
ncbi:MAG TPA: hypothetical protein VGS12_13340 [Caulobacteraceae bacterium]|nr:hypothetical protein [Caulobacteraceae bacterium]